MSTNKTPTATSFATSADGTEIAYDVTAQDGTAGPALVIVEGAMCQRSMGAGKILKDTLKDRFTVHCYDRRGRGESGPGASAYDVQREVEDLAAVIDAAGGSPYVFGASSGAVLALEAARQGVPMERLAVYESPFKVDGTAPPNDPGLGEQTRALVDAGRRGDAVKLFMRVVGVPRPMIAVMPLFPMWKQVTSIAHTLPNDFAIVLPFQQGKPLPAGYYAEVKPETLVIAGGKSPEYMRNAQAAIAAQLPHRRLTTLPGQTHMIKAKATAPVLVNHFVGG
jgi:pimeloyl-ACP methyl ester carboxylesterase